MDSKMRQSMLMSEYNSLIQMAQDQGILWKDPFDGRPPDGIDPADLASVVATLRSLLRTPHGR